MLCEVTCAGWTSERCHGRMSGAMRVGTGPCESELGPACQVAHKLNDSLSNSLLQLPKAVRQNLPHGRGALCPPGLAGISPQQGIRTLETRSSCCLRSMREVFLLRACTISRASSAGKAGRESFSSNLRIK